MSKSVTSSGPRVGTEAQAQTVSETGSAALGSLGPNVGQCEVTACLLLADGQEANPAQPSCDTSRNGSTSGSARTCAVCPRALESSRSRYCSPAHRQYAFRLRRVQLTSVDERQLRAELRRRRALVAHTVYECSSCGERSVGERRCQECNLFSRALGLGGRCKECDEPMLLAELLELEVIP